MGSSASDPDPTREDVRALFSRLEPPGKPVSAATVADRLECPQKRARETLLELTELGELQTTEIQGRTRVWWQPHRMGEGQPSNQDDFSTFVSAVEDYAIFRLNPDGMVANWNEGAERIKGYQEDEIIGQHFSTFYTDTAVDESIPERNLETAAREGRVEDEGWRVRKDGSQFWANVTITAVRDEDGELQGFTKVTRDMTERREYEQQLRREHDLIEQILETAPVGIGVLDADGQFVRANPQLLERHGIDDYDLSEYGLSDLDIFDARGDQIPKESWPLWEILETGNPVTDFQCQVDPPAGDRRWLSINAAPLAESPGDGDQVVTVVEDITEQKARQQQLRRERDQTEQLLQTAPIAIAVQNSDGETILANERAQEALDLSEHEIIAEDEATNEWKLYDENGTILNQDETPSTRVLETREPVLNEHLIIEPPDGNRMQFRVNAAPIYDSKGSIDRVITTAEDITELKEREQELEQRKTELETELSEILGRISDAFYALDTEWRFTHLNDRAAEIFHRPADELIDRSITELYPQIAEGDVWDHFQMAMETQDPVDFEWYVEELDMWLEFALYPSETGLSVYFRDITDRKTREEELTKYETIIETINDAIYVIDDDLRFTMVNDAYTELTGYNREEILGEHASVVIDDETIEQGRQVREQLAAGEVSNPTLESTVEMASGDQVPVEASFAALPTAGDEPKRIGVVRDITERKARERELQESERRYRTLVENFPNGAVELFDEELRYTAVGGELISEIGVTAADRVGTRIHEIYPDDLLETVEPYFHDALAGEANSFEAQYQGRDLLAYTLPIRNADDEVYAGMLVVQDITELKETQRQLEASNERLEQFAYAASHDLQEPLRMVSSYLQLLKRRYGDDLDEEGEEFIEFAVDGAERMREMIDGLLAYSRVETRGDPFVQVALESVLNSVRDDLQVKIEENNAEISAESLPRVAGDESQLRQLFQNLLDNAIEYSDEEPPRIDVGAEREGDEWIISVEDNGIGIEPDRTDQVFQVFQRLHSQAEHEGTGIGLALCKRIVERHGGEIWIESEPGEGTTFLFSVPAVTDHEDTLR